MEKIVELGKRELEEFISRIKRGKFFLCMPSDPTLNNYYRKKMILDKFNKLKNTYPRKQKSKQYQKIAKIYEEESMHRFENALRIHYAAREKNLVPGGILGELLDTFEADWKGIASFWNIPYDPADFDELKPIFSKIKKVEPTRPGRKPDFKNQERDKYIKSLRAQDFSFFDICYHLDNAKCKNFPKSWHYVDWATAEASITRKVHKFLSNICRKR